MASGGGRLDTLGMFEAAAGLPEQVAAAVEVGKAVEGLPDHESIANVLILGMGGSAIAGDVLAAVAGPFMPVPVVVTNGYEPPSFVDESTLVIALSFSGNAEETVEAAGIAAAAGGRMLVVAGGGELERLARSWHAPVLTVPAGLPMPRAALGALTIPALMALERMGLFPGASSWVDLAIEQLARRRDQLVADGNPAQRLARDIGRTLPVIYGGGPLGRVAATRWKSQCNSNAKVPAFANVIPELCHNEIAGWGQHGDLTRQVFTLLLLRHDHEHPQVSRRFDLVVDLLDEVVADHFSVHAEGEGELAQLLDLMLFGDFVSLHLAAQEGLDPGPVPVLTQIKEDLTSH